MALRELRARKCSIVDARRAVVCQSQALVTRGSSSSASCGAPVAVLARCRGWGGSTSGVERTFA
eukprot:13334081-Alexandrium_andersonii.AAC.1